MGKVFCDKCWQFAWKLVSTDVLNAQYVTVVCATLYANTFTSLLVQSTVFFYWFRMTSHSEMEIWKCWIGRDCDCWRSSSIRDEETQAILASCGSHSITDMEKHKAEMRECLEALFSLFESEESEAAIDLLERIKKFKTHAFAMRKCVGDGKSFSGKSLIRR